MNTQTEQIAALCAELESLRQAQERASKCGDSTSCALLQIEIERIEAEIAAQS